MTCLVFETPGLIDIRAFTLMGVSAKPSTTSPIGYFGTGLKYAIATLVRLGGKPVVWIGEDRYTFFKREGEFRGVAFDKISMRRDRFGLLGKGRITDMPFTTMYGRTWKPWMVVRELESNTRDENGSSYITEGSIILSDAGITRIVIEDADVIEAYRSLNNIFLPGAERSGTGVQVIEEPSKYLYWRGLRVYELGTAAQRTYNIRDHVYLTEDRTLQGEWHARSLIAQWAATEADRAQVAAIVTAEEGEVWESCLEFDRSVPPSPAFRDTMLNYPKGGSRSAYRYFSAHDNRVTEDSFDLLDVHPLPWSVEGSEVKDSKGVTVFDAPFGYEGRWDIAAKAIIKKLGGMS